MVSNTKDIKYKEQGFSLMADTSMASQSKIMPKKFTLRQELTWYRQQSEGNVERTMQHPIMAILSINRNVIIQFSVVLCCR